MSVEENKLVVGRFVDEFWNARDLSVADEIFSPSCVTHQLKGENDDITAPRTPETIKNEAREWIRGFPDLKFTVIQTLADDDRVMSQIQVTGTHRGEWMGLSSSGTSVNFPLFVIHKIASGKIIEDWVLVGTLTLFQQLDLVPTTSKLIDKGISGE